MSMNRTSEPVWDEFLQRWPQQALATMTLAQYAQGADEDCFSGWLRYLSDELGWRPGGGTHYPQIGVSALPATSLATYRGNPKYGVDEPRLLGWLRELGSSAEEAFANTRARLCQIAEAAARGDVSVLAQPVLYDIYEWKLFFIYQNRQQPVLLPLQRLDDIPQWYHGKFGTWLQRGKRPKESDLAFALRCNQLLMAVRDGLPVFDYVAQLKQLVEARYLAQESPQTGGGWTMPSFIPERKYNMPALNQILYGPPGTGKTYETIHAALQILDPAAADAYKLVDQDDESTPDERLAARKALKARFDELAAEQRVRFVTFHQSFSYEDFVEGLRAETDESSGQIRYEVVDGIFKSVCESASVKVTQQAPAPVDLTGRRVWKMSLGNTQGSDADIFDECLQGGYVLLGYGSSIDFSGCKSREDVLQRYAAAGQTIAENTDYNLTSVTTFVTRMQIGDLVVVSDGNFKFRAIGEITGEYAYKPHPDYDDSYAQMRPVRWLRRYTPSLPRTELLNSQFSQMTLYELRSPALDKKKLAALLGASSSLHVASQFYVGQVFGRDYRVVRVTDDLLEISKPNGNLLPLSMNFLRELGEAVHAGKITIEDIRQKSAMSKLTNSQLEPFLVNGYPNILAPLVEQLCQAENVTKDQRDQLDARVLIIDEINRGNISRIFGELITLIEPSKRAGADEALSVTLPYSKETFSVPDNVYIIGTMNTADRSLAGLDLALRRRFSFTEMPPRPALLKSIKIEEVEDLDLADMLEKMNQRITVLLGRDHTIGHAYFMPLQTTPTRDTLADIFRQKILPLLQEYFFEDWERIRWVLNDHTKPDSVAFIIEDKSLDVSGLFAGVADKLRQSPQWVLNDKAFDETDAYRGIAANLGKGEV